MRKWAAIALAAPGCLLASASVTALTLAIFDRHPMWPHQEFNLAEAAGVRDEAEVARLIENGADPNMRYPVRPMFIFDDPVSLTPLEAAIAANDPQILSQLLMSGATMDARLWTYLRCIADGDRVSPLLDQYRPEGATLPHCDGIVPPWRLDD